MSDYAKPLPSANPDGQPFWASCKAHAMALQRCLGCGRFRFPPRTICPGCHSADSEWRPIAGRGRVYVSLVMSRPPNPAWEGDVPYNVSQIELEEGVRLWSNVIGCDPHAVTIGDDVRIVYDDVTDQVALPKFRRVSDGA